MPTIVIVNSQPTLRKGLRMLLASEDGMQVAGEAPDGRTGIALCSALQPDVALVDVGVPEAAGLAVVAALRAACPHTRVIALSLYDDAAARQRAERAGAVKLIPMQAPGDMLEAIRQAAR